MSAIYVVEINPPSSLSGIKSAPMTFTETPEPDLLPADFGEDGVWAEYTFDHMCAPHIVAANPSISMKSMPPTYKQICQSAGPKSSFSLLKTRPQPRARKSPLHSSAPPPAAPSTRSAASACVKLSVKRSSSF